MMQQPGAKATHKQHIMLTRPHSNSALKRLAVSLLRS